MGAAARGMHFFARGLEARAHGLAIQPPALAHPETTFRGSVFVLRSHNLTNESSPPLASTRPSCENTTQSIPSRPALRVVISFFDATSHSLRVWSELPVAKVRPSDVNATALTRYL